MCCSSPIVNVWLHLHFNFGACASTCVKIQKITETAAAESKTANPEPLLLSCFCLCSVRAQTSRSFEMIAQGRTVCLRYQRRKRDVISNYSHGGILQHLTFYTFTHSFQMVVFTSHYLKHVQTYKEVLHNHESCSSIVLIMDMRAQK